MNVFEKFALEYDEWFDIHKWVYQSEVEAVRRHIPKIGKGIEKGKRKEDKFYRNARFYSVNQVLDWLKKLEFDNLQTVQTIFKTLDKIQRLEPVEEGFGNGLFVVISAENKK